MDHESLRTAGTYLNNLLLARGLLRNGEPIDFVKPSKDSRAQIINLVHDLILRQDRDREQREHVAVTLRSLRAEETRRSHDFEQLKAKCDETARQRDTAQAAERAAAAEVKKVERAMKSLQEQAAKVKTQLAQVKTQCTNDLRKRDLELARLKTHLQGQQRGSRTTHTAPSMKIIGAGGAEGARRTADHSAEVHDLEDPEYNLRQETTEFLTQLSQSLSDENDNLITLIRDALSDMRGLLGLPAQSAHPDSAIGSMGSHPDSQPGKVSSQTTAMFQALPTSYDALSTALHATLSHLKNLLTNPNFVSMEEVEVRDEEITRLREGWDRMEQRWKDVLLMMQGWLRRMDTGETINIDDLRRGMGLVSPNRDMIRPDTTHDVDNSLTTNGDDEDGEAGANKLPALEEEPSLVLSEPRGLLPNGSPKRKRDLLEPPEFFDLRPKSSTATSPRRNTSVHFENEDFEDDDEFDAPSPSGDEANVNSARFMTVAEKLALAQTEADEAAAATSAEKSLNASSATLASRKSTAKHENGADEIPNFDGSALPARNESANVSLRNDENGEGDDTLAPMIKNISPITKRANIRGRPRKKRKSTLSPEELEELLGSGNADEDVF